MLLRPQQSAFQWDSGLQGIWVLLKRLHAVKSRQPGSCTQPELVRQLSLTICLNPAAAVLGQTSFLCLLADTISDRLWLWFSFGLRVQCSVKILVQPTQRLPSIGERVNACFQFEQYFSCCFVSGPQPLINCSNLLPDCRQLWFVHIKCIQWTSPASLQRGHTSSSSVSVLRLVPSWDCQTHQCSCSLHLQQEKMFNKGSSSPDDRAGTEKTQQCLLCITWYWSPSLLILSFLYLHIYKSSLHGTQVPAKPCNCNSQGLGSDYW